MRILETEEATTGLNRSLDRASAMAQDSSHFQIVYKNTEFYKQDDRGMNRLEDEAFY
jgi:hypothetical protein